MDVVKRAINAALVIVSLASYLASADAGNQKAKQAQTYEQWEKTAQEAGAGEPVGVPPEEGISSHDAWCENVKGWCPTVTNGVIAGKQWCLGKPGAKTKPNCYYSHRNRSYSIYLAWKDYIDANAGGAVPLFMAGTIRTESEGVWDAKTASFTEECGLASVDLVSAKARDVNACDPEANIWAMGFERNTRMLQLRAKYPQASLAPLADQWKIAGACGAIGSNKVYNVIDKSGAFSLKSDGTLRHASPYKRIGQWLTWADKNFDLYSFAGSAMLSHNPGKGAFRILRPEAQEAILGPLYKDGVPYGEPVLPDRPAGILSFPGKDQHCKCWKWPELATKKPAPYASDPDLLNPKE